MHCTTKIAGNQLCFFVFRICGISKSEPGVKERRSGKNEKVKYACGASEIDRDDESKDKVMHIESSDVNNDIKERSVERLEELTDVEHLDDATTPACTTGVIE